jgi:predicted PhzF superfamily epimerase YddE/YHI9
MATIPFALYDAFSDTAFGGSQAGVVSDASGLDIETMQRIARELGAPPTTNWAPATRHCQRILT